MEVCSVVPLKGPQTPQTAVVVIVIVVEVSARSCYLICRPVVDVSHSGWNMITK